MREGGAGSAVPARVLASCSLHGSSCSSWDQTLTPKHRLALPLLLAAGGGAMGPRQLPPPV